MINTSVYPISAFFGKVDRETAILFGWEKIIEVVNREKKEIGNYPNEVNNHQKDSIKSNENNNLSKSETLAHNSNEFPSVQLSVKNPISSKVLVFLMLLQVFSNIGIFMLLLNVLE